MPRYIWGADRLKVSTNDTAGDAGRWSGDVARPGMPYQGSRDLRPIHTYHARSHAVPLACRAVPLACRAVKV
jgi:hypothetical protein